MDIFEKIGDAFQSLVLNFLGKLPTNPFSFSSWVGQLDFLPGLNYFIPLQEISSAFGVWVALMSALTLGFAIYKLIKSKLF